MRAKEYLVGLGGTPQSFEEGPCRVCRLNPFHSENGEYNYSCLGPERVPLSQQRMKKYPPYFMIESTTRLKPKYLNVPSHLLFNSIDSEDTDDWGFDIGLKKMMNCWPFVELLETK